MKNIYANITDIKFSNNQCYLLKTSTISAAQIEQEVEGFPHYQTGYPTDRAIEKMLLPPLIYFFYTFVFEHQKTPPPQALWDCYLGAFTSGDSSEELLLENCNKKISLAGVKGRFMRTYPSLLRDFYLYHIIKESNFFDNVSYSLQSDYFEGLDICVKKESLKMYLNIYLNSSKALFHRSSKKSRMGRSENLGLVEIELILSERLLRNVNGYYLPTKKCVDLVIQKFESHKNL
jgi:hypothetical protein